MPLIGDLTRPENCVERRDRLRIAAKVTQAGGCAYCIHRQPVLGRFICSGTAGRSFPLCLHDKRKPGFEMDDEALRRQG